MPKPIQELLSHRLTLLVVALVGSVVLWAHEGHKPLPTKGAQVDLEKGLIYLTAEARDGLAIKAVAIEQRPIEDHLLAYARVVTPWGMHAFASSPIAGRVRQVFAQPGDQVEENQVLAEVEGVELEQMQLRYLAALKNVELSSLSLKRAQELSRQQTIPGRDLLTAETEHQKNLSDVEISRNQLQSLGLLPEQIDALGAQGTATLVPSLPLRSPISGTVVHSDVDVGRSIRPLEHLVEVTNLTQVWIAIDVVESDWLKVSVGQSVEVRLTAFAQTPLQLTIARKDIGLNDETHLGVVWCESPNVDGALRLLPGMTGQARIAVKDDRPALAVPQRALLSNGMDRFVLVEEEFTKKGSQFRRKPVVVLHETGEFGLIRLGDLFPSDRVVTVGGHELATFFVPGALRPSAAALANMGVVMERPQRVAIDDYISVPGQVRLSSFNRSAVSSPLDGTIQQILVGPGQPVNRGDEIVRILSLEFQQIQLNLLQAELESRSLESVVESLRKQGSQVLAQRQLIEAESAFAIARDRRDSNRRQLRILGMSDEQLAELLAQRSILRELPIRAAIDGVITRFEPALGQAVRADETMLEVLNMVDPRIEALVSESEFPFVRIGQAARVRVLSNPQSPLEGTVIQTSDTLQTRDRSMSVWIELNSQTPSLIQQNMLVDVTLVSGTGEPRLSLPRSAIVTDGSRKYVFVQLGDGAFERRLIQLGRTDDRRVEVLAGLSDHDLVAIAGISGLRTAFASIR